MNYNLCLKYDGSLNLKLKNLRGEYFNTYFADIFYTTEEEAAAAHVSDNDYERTKIGFIQLLNYNQALAPYLEKKAGYLLGEVIDGKIVLKTFLFLTNTGTPEADKLKAATGLMKEDIMYLAIDKLSTFVYSDIAGNDRLKQLFIDAGCESLFKIDKESFVTRDDNTITAKAEMITKYLQVDALPNYRGFKK